METKDMAIHKTGNLLVDVLLTILVFVFPPIYDFTIAFISLPFREFFVETRELIQWLLAVLVLIKFIRDLFFPKKKNTNRKFRK